MAEPHWEIVRSLGRERSTGSCQPRWLRPLAQKQVWGLSSSGHPHPVEQSWWHSAGALQPSSWHRALPHFWLSRGRKRHKIDCQPGQNRTPDLICQPGKKSWRHKDQMRSARCVRFGDFGLELQIVSNSLVIQLYLASKSHLEHPACDDLSHVGLDLLLDHLSKGRRIKLGNLGQFWGH